MSKFRLLFVKRNICANHFIVFAAVLIWLIWSRFIGNNYDAGLHLHPDERWLTMLQERLHLFSKLDPNFFAYGTFPLYLLKALVQFLTAFTGKIYESYDGALVAGRWLSSLADIGTAFAVFELARRTVKQKLAPWLGLTAYALFFFTIQNSNFFIVDNYLNLFLVWSLIYLLRFYQEKRWQWLTVCGIFLGLATASKITALAVLPVLFLAPWILIKKSIIKFPFLLQYWSRLTITLVLTFSFAMPYAVIHFSQFVREVSQQLAMNSNAYVFPYTLQYIDTTPYLYYLKQAFFWGIGPLASIWAAVGFISLIKSEFSTNRRIWLVTLFYVLYFLIAGRSAVKFMRYLLPIYPFLAVLVGQGMSWWLEQKRFSHSLRKFVTGASIIGMIIWVMGFISIYFQPHSRVTASMWINNHIPAQSVLAIEHWDDRLPFMGQEKYQFEELPIYELPDDEKKWAEINKQLVVSDYLILASNRLWLPLPKLADCQNRPKCYPLTAEYYHKLFSGSLSFKKVAEFSSYPSWPTPWGRIQLNDDKADESFTVYDHPKVMIFKNTTR